jgi:hypothetical protein
MHAQEYVTKSNNLLLFTTYFIDDPSHHLGTNTD